MSESNITWFHCGRCGSLFLSPAGETDERTCTECGRKPSLGLEAPAAESETSSTPLPAHEKTAHHGERERHSSRRRGTDYFIAKLVVGWLVFLLAIIFGARWLWKSDNESNQPAVTQAPAANDASQEDVSLLVEASPQCNQVFSAFLAAGTPEERNQFVLSPITTAARMARFYGLNPMVNVDPRTMTSTGSSVLHLPSRRAIETHWKTADDRQLDAVFIEENGEWRLDWDHFARYSDYPWALFLAGSGEDHGEFRLLARERLADQRKNSESISIVLYSPRAGLANEAGFQSPEFLIRRDTKNGRLLDAAFQLEREGKNAFGMQLPGINPPGLIRVRVKVRRVEQNQVRKFELEDIAACHWYSEDAPGVEIPEPPPQEK
ncbi:MAG: hypothetical protein V4584_17615 [Verrucomicrobiota bacterium]